MFKQNFANLLESEMDRKDFLKALGVTLVAFTGAAAAFKTISSNPALVSGMQNKSQGVYGYGSSAYGGNKTAAREQSAPSTYA